MGRLNSHTAVLALVVLCGVAIAARAQASVGAAATPSSTDKLAVQARAAVSSRSLLFNACGIKGCAKCNATTKACTKCAPLLYVLNAAANTCDCAAGYGAYLKNGAPVLGAKCLPCVVPTYQDTVTTPGVAVCTACPSNTSVPTPTLGTDVSQCTVCAPGYGDETGASNPLACTICAAGSYMYNASAPCTPCADPAYTTPTAGSFTGKLCTVPVCAPNTQLGKGANKKLVCLPCPAGTCSPGGDPTQGLLQPKCTAC